MAVNIYQFAFGPEGSNLTSALSPSYRDDTTPQLQRTHSEATSGKHCSAHTDISRSPRSEPTPPLSVPSYTTLLQKTFLPDSTLSLVFHLFTLDHAESCQ